MYLDLASIYTKVNMEFKKHHTKTFLVHIIVLKENYKGNLKVWIKTIINIDNLIIEIKSNQYFCQHIFII